MSNPRAVRAVLLLFLVMGTMGCFPSRTMAQDQDPLPEKAGELKEAKRATKLDRLDRFSTWYLRAGGALDAFSTVRALNHPTIAHREDGTFLMNYPVQETGWARSFGARNPAAVVAANAGLNLGVEWLSRRLYRKGGRWQYLAVGLKLWKGSDNLAAGIGNLRYSAGIDQRVQQATGYAGRIVWTRN